MAAQGLTERIDARIEKAFSGPKLTARVRRAELLLRNAAFLRALEETKYLAKREIKDVDRGLERARRKLELKDARADDLTAEDRRIFDDDQLPSVEFFVAQRKRSIIANDFAWLRFCADWGIDMNWDGSPDKLSQYAIGTAAIFFQSKDGNSGFIPLGNATKPAKRLRTKAQARAQIGQPPMGPEAMLESLMPIQGWAPFIEISISPSTEQGEIIKAWSRIEKLKKEVWGFSAAEGRTFQRDLCFWDLRNKPEYEQRPCQTIAERWNRTWPAHKVSRIIVDQSAKRIQRFIDRITDELSGNALL